MDRTTHERMVNDWRQAREGRLRAADGWLTLVDRLVLDDGDNALPFGTLSWRDGEATVRVDPGAIVTCDGAPISERAFRPSEGERSPVLVHAGRRYELFRRGDVAAVRVKDPQAPARLTFAGLTYYPIDPAWRIEAVFDRFDPPRQTVHQLDIGQSGPRQIPGIARFQVGAETLSLEPTLEEDTRRLFFVFTDRTNRTDTSPAGRFLYADLPNGPSCILDFNLAFNPPCAFTSFATCPIPPPANRLPAAVTAGEKDPNHG